MRPVWVIDTNVFVSAYLSPDGYCSAVLDAVLDRRVFVAYDERIIAEYRDVLSRPRMRIPPADTEHLWNSLIPQQRFVTVPHIKLALPDPDDLPFIEVALRTEDRTIITGNLRHFTAAERLGVRILSPAQAVALLDI